LTELSFVKIGKRGSVYLSIINRSNSRLGVAARKMYIFFTPFRSARLNNDRYVLSRYHLVRLSKKLGIYRKFNYCLSHSRNYSAVLLSSDLENISVDLEYAGRRLSESLKSKIRILYADLNLSELSVIMILETLVKLKNFSPPVTLAVGVADDSPVKIIPLRDNVFEVDVYGIKAYSRLSNFRDLCICITIEDDRFDCAV
jgi:hypothetical protein